MDSERLLKYLRGDSNLWERMSVNRWTRQSETNRKELSAMRAVYSALLMTEDIPQKTARSSGVKARTLLAAAAVAACIAGGILLFIPKDTSPATKPDNEYMYLAPPGINMNILLPDGSKVTLVPGSRLSYSEPLKGGRMARLSGEAFFEVAKDPQNPFCVDAEGVRVTVRGTSFSINTSPETITVLLETGRVEIENGSSSATMLPGQKYEFEKESGNVSISQMEPEEYRDYEFNYLVFENAPISSIFAQISKAFDIVIVSDIPSGKQKCLTGKLDLCEGFEQSLKNIGFIVPFSGAYDSEGVYHIKLD